MPRLWPVQAYAILSYDLDSNIVTWNRAAQRLYGYTAEEAVGQSLEILYPPDWPKRVTEYRDEIIAGTLRSFEAIRVAKDGSERNVWITCAPIRFPDGAIHSPTAGIDWSETCVEGSITPTNGGFGRMVLTKLPKTMLDAVPSYCIADSVLYWSISISDCHYLRAN